MPSNGKFLEPAELEAISTVPVLSDCLQKNAGLPDCHLRCHQLCTTLRFDSESVSLQTPSFPPGDCVAAAPDESWIGEQCVIADHSSYPAAQAPSASAPRKSREQQRASVRITDPLWQYAALAVYPDRLKTKTASS